jgi:hypothetical protein
MGGPRATVGSTLGIGQLQPRNRSAPPSPPDGCHLRTRWVSPQDQMRVTTGPDGCNRHGHRARRPRAERRGRMAHRGALRGRAARNRPSVRSAAHWRCRGTPQAAELPRAPSLPPIRFHADAHRRPPMSSTPMRHAAPPDAGSGRSNTVQPFVTVLCAWTESCNDVLKNPDSQKDSGLTVAGYDVAGTTGTRWET